MKLKHNRGICIGDAAEKRTKDSIRRELDGYGDDHLLWVIKRSSREEWRDVASDMLIESLKKKKKPSVN
tara:strand:- start:33 stop:239 length:207 start_codon:yes stop_codon:yes gene_type:complete